MNKRGISAIIASILLILFVISLFSVITYFLKKNSGSVIEQGSESFEKMINCDEINLYVEEFCYSTNKVECPESASEKCGLIGIKLKNNNKLGYEEGFRLKLSSGYSNIFIPERNVLEPYSVTYIYMALPKDQKTSFDWIKVYPIINGQTCDTKESMMNMKGVKECP